MATKVTKAKKTPVKVKPKAKRKMKKKNKNLSFKDKALSFLWNFTWKTTLVVIASLFLMGIYFDQKIERKLEGQTWDLPAQVYARPLLLEKGKYLSQTAFIKALKQLNYRAVRRVQAKGQFSVYKNTVNVFRRSFEVLEQFEPDLKVKINFEDGKIRTIRSEGKKFRQIRFDPLLLTRLTSNQAEDRVFVPFEKIPNLFIETLLLMEDRDYYHHQGVSPLAIVRAFIVNFQAGHTVQGGSTLTQQLAKNLFLSQKRSLWRKFQEAYIAVLLDYKYSKDKLLEAYLNEVYLAQNGNKGVYGIGLASDFYFARPINELRVDQIALLVAIIKGPSYYNPRRNPERALNRRDLVLRMMVENSLINKSQYQYAVKDNLNLPEKRALNKRSNPAFVSLLKRELKQQVGSGILKQSGLSIFTSIDPISQQHAEKGVVQGIKHVKKKGQKDLQGAMVISDRKYAEIRAIVAGKNVKYNGFNRALDARRPIGSLVKPPVYLTALEKGFTLDSQLQDKAIVLKNSIGQRWKPKNYDRKFRGEVSFAYALIHSLNVPTVNLGMQVGLHRIINNLHKMGVDRKIKAYPSLVLGSLSLSPFEVAQMYQPITMQGRYKKLSMIRGITSSEGDILYRRSNRFQQVFSKKSVNDLNGILHDVTQTGTARSLRWRNPGGIFYGKTGTTNKLNDSWFVGFDHSELLSIWVGRDNNKSAGLTGSSGALVLFSEYMKQKGH